MPAHRGRRCDQGAAGTVGRTRQGPRAGGVRKADVQGAHGGRAGTHMTSVQGALVGHARGAKCVRVGSTWHTWWVHKRTGPARQERVGCTTGMHDNMHL